MIDERELNDTLKKIDKECRFRRYEGSPVEWAFVEWTYLEGRLYAVRRADKKSMLTFVIATSPLDAVQRYVELFKTINIQHLESLA